MALELVQSHLKVERVVAVQEVEDENGGGMHGVGRATISHE